jgi:hypothetical protein
MAENFLPTLAWFMVVAVGVAIIVEAVNNREGTRQIVQAALGALLVLAFLANAWAGMSRWAYCEDNRYECEPEEEG